MYVILITLYTEKEFKEAKTNTLLPCKCKICQKKFFKQKRVIQRVLRNEDNQVGNYCSNKCFGSDNITKKEVICKHCNKFFMKLPNQIKKTKNSFCSRSCAATYNNTHKTHGTRKSKLEVWLEQQLPTLYPNLEFHFNRKDVINSELDIYIPSLKLAFELNGIFHYEPIYGEEKLSQIQNNDQRKFQACLEKGIELCLIDVSSMINFKEKKAYTYLNGICNIINDKVS